jgi:hypothetical protein
MHPAAPITRKSRGFEADNTTKAAAQTSALGNERGFLPHQFNPQIARVYSLPAALVFQYIFYRCAAEKAKFITFTVSELAERYPYMDRTTVLRALNLLVYPTDNPALVSRKIIKGVYYYGIVPTDKSCGTYRFDVRIATELGIAPAIILASVGYWVKMNWKQKAEEAVRKLDPKQFDYDHPAMFEEALVQTVRGAAHTTTIEDWVTRHSYLSERTARRGFSCLLKAGLLEKRPGKHHKTIYTLNVDLLSKYGDKLLSLSGKTNSPAKLHQSPANLHQSPANSHQEQGVNKCVEAGSKSLDEALSDEAFSDQHGDAFAPPALADARSVVARSASNSDFSPALRADLSRLNQPGYARRKKRSSKKRSYTRLPKPDDPDFDLYIDDLPPVEREKYLASLR